MSFGQIEFIIDRAMDEATQLQQLDRFTISPALLGPGFMWDNQNKLHAASGSPYFSRDPDAVAAAKINAVPLTRLGTSSEVVQAVAYLLSDDSSYVTGANLVVSGGLA